MERIDVRRGVVGKIAVILSAWSTYQGNMSVCCSSKVAWKGFGKGGRLLVESENMKHVWSLSLGQGRDDRFCSRELRGGSCCLGNGSVSEKHGVKRVRDLVKI